MSRRVYEEIRTLVEEHGGTMEFQRPGYRWGAWIIRYAGKEKAFPSHGGLFPGIDDLHVPNINQPRHYDDYKNELIDDAWEILLKMLDEPNN